MVTAFYEVTYACPARCPFCYNAWKADKNYPVSQMLDLEQIKDLADILKRKFSVDSVVLTGGEPLLRKDLEEIALIFHERGMEIALSTIGIGLDLPRAKRLVESGVKEFMISLHSSDPELNDKIVRRKGTFHETLNAINSVVAAGAAVSVFFVPTKENMCGFEEYVDMLKTCGVNSLMINRYIPFGAAALHRDELMPEMEEYSKFLVTANRICLERGLAMQCSLPVPNCAFPSEDIENVINPPCHAGGRKIGVDPAGNLRPCEQIPHIAGNLLEEEYASVKKSLTAYMATDPQTCGSMV